MLDSLTYKNVPGYYVRVKDIRLFINDPRVLWVHMIMPGVSGVLGYDFSGHQADARGAFGILSTVVGTSGRCRATIKPGRGIRSIGQGQVRCIDGYEKGVMVCRLSPGKC